MNSIEYVEKYLGKRVKVRKTRNGSKNRVGTVVGYCGCGSDCSIVVELEGDAHGVDAMAAYSRPADHNQCAYVLQEYIVPFELPPELKVIPDLLSEHIESIKKMPKSELGAAVKKYDEYLGAIESFIMPEEVKNYQRKIRENLMR